MRMMNVKAEMDVMVSMKWCQAIIQIQDGSPNAVNAIVPKEYSSNQYLHDPSSQCAKFFTLFTVGLINIKEDLQHMNVMYLNKPLQIFINHSGWLAPTASKSIHSRKSVITKRKYNRRRLTSEIWIFGGICRQTGERFVFQVLDRSADTLNPPIQVYIKPHSIIHSEGWAAYNEISNLPEQYQHFVVNHSKNFVDPDTGCHTQSVEKMWREVKKIRRILEVINQINIDGYIAEYLW